MSVQKPEQELRFTRANQALPLWLLSGMLVACAITLFATTWFRDMRPNLWSILFLVPAWLLAKLSYRMTRHAYIILTPLGIEVFPLFRPQSGMRMIYWQEIDSMDVDELHSSMTLHFNADKTGGVHLSLRPIPVARRKLLVHAVQERLKK